MIIEQFERSHVETIERHFRINLTNFMNYETKKSKLIDGIIWIISAPWWKNWCLFR